LNPVEALIFSQASSFQLLKLEIYHDDHSLISTLCTVGQVSVGCQSSISRTVKDR